MNDWIPNIDWYYTEENIAIACGDCLEVMKKLPSEIIDLIITDPPYNIKYKYDIYKDNLSDKEYINLISNFRSFKSVFIHYPEETIKYLSMALGAPDEVVAWCYNSHISKKFRLITFYNFKPDFSKIKIPYKNPTDKRIKKEINKGNGANLYDWWDDIQEVKNISKDKFHPCSIPEKLAKRLVMISSNEGDLILDPFMGSGTILKACKDLGRKGIGIEISEEYVNIAIKRCSQEVLPL